MAEFISRCPYCHAELQMQDEWAGMDVECSSCHSTFTVEKSAAPLELYPQAVKTVTPSVVPTPTVVTPVTYPAYNRRPPVPSVRGGSGRAKTFFLSGVAALLLIAAGVGAGIYYYNAESVTPASSTSNNADGKKENSPEKSGGGDIKKTSVPVKSTASASPKKVSGVYASQISSVMSDYSYHNTMASNINQQICNGTYRTVELLNIIAQQHGCSTGSIMSDYSYHNTMASNINQQICNGTYRTVELLNLIARKNDQ